jgi:hypothetical protein
MSTVAKRDRNEVLDDLLEYHQGKLDEIRVKRGYSTLDRHREIVIDGAVNLKIDPSRKELIVSWGQ